MYFTDRGIEELAERRGYDLARSYAYSDSITDVHMLEVVGHPHAVNPDFRLAREARRRQWPILSWDTEPGARTRPPEPVASGA